MKALRMAALLAALAAGLPWAAAAAVLSGSVLSTDGLGLPGVRLSATPEPGGPAATAVSGDRGLFTFRALAAGAVVVRAELAGFSPAAARLSLAEGADAHVELRLRLAPVRAELTVVGPAPLESLEAVEIRESPARDAGEALSQLPGVAKLRKGGIANDIVVRGLQSRDLNVLVDGERVYGACPNHMDPPAFHVDFAEVERIEVGKGPFDVLNQGSLGGVVNIVTKQPEAGLHASANVAGGSFGYLNPSASVSWGSGTLSALAGISHRRSEAYSDGSGKRFTELTNYAASSVDVEAFRVGTAWARVGWTPSPGHALQASYTRQEADHVYYPYLQMDAVFDDSDRAGLTYERTGLSGTLRSFSVRAYFSQVSHWMTDEYRTSASGMPRPYSMGTDAFSRSFGGKLEGQLGPVKAGVEAYRRSWETTTLLAGMAYAPQASLPDVDTDSVGLYARTSLPLSRGLDLDAGLRLDRASTSADARKANTDLWYAYLGTRSTSSADTLPAGNLRLRWGAADGVEVALGVGHTARLPEAQERYFALRRMGSDWVGNPDLSPSRNTGADLTASYRRSGVSVSASLFSSAVQDFITLYSQKRASMVPGVMNATARSTANVDARLLGGEATAAVQLPFSLFASGTVSYVRGRQDPRPELGIVSEDLPEMPPLSGRASLRFDDGSIWAEAEGVFAAAQTHVDATLRESATPGWGVLNLRAGVSWQGLGLVLGIANLFDRTYAEHLSYQRDPFRNGVRVTEPGRNLYVNVSYRY